MQNSVPMEYRGGNSWGILSVIEKSIKAKIECKGVPLKDWNVNIYRGVITGFNEAFIITKQTRDQLVADDPKSAEIIRPNNLCCPVFQTICLKFSFLPSLFLRLSHKFFPSVQVFRFLYQENAFLEHVDTKVKI